MSADCERIYARAMHRIAFVGCTNEAVKNKYASAIRSLNGQFIDKTPIIDPFPSACTHLIVFSFHKSKEYVMIALATGKFILKPSFITASNEKGSWQPEMLHIFTKADQCSNTLAQNVGLYSCQVLRRYWEKYDDKGGLFADWTAGVVCSTNSKKAFWSRILHGGFAKYRKNITTMNCRFPYIHKELTHVFYDDDSPPMHSDVFIMLKNNVAVLPFSFIDDYVFGLRSESIADHLADAKELWAHRCPTRPSLFNLDSSIDEDNNIIKRERQSSMSSEEVIALSDDDAGDLRLKVSSTMFLSPIIKNENKENTFGGDGESSYYGSSTKSFPSSTKTALPRSKTKKSSPSKLFDTLPSTREGSSCEPNRKSVIDVQQKNSVVKRLKLDSSPVNGAKIDDPIQKQKRGRSFGSTNKKIQPVSSSVVDGPNPKRGRRRRDDILLSQEQKQTDKNKKRNREQSKSVDDNGAINAVLTSIKIKTGSRNSLCETNVKSTKSATNKRKLTKNQHDSEEIRIENVIEEVIRKNGTSEISTLTDVASKTDADDKNLNFPSSLNDRIITNITKKDKKLATSPSSTTRGKLLKIKSLSPKSREKLSITTASSPKIVKLAYVVVDRMECTKNLTGEKNETVVASPSSNIVHDGRKDFLSELSDYVHSLNLEADQCFLGNRPKVSDDRRSYNPKKLNFFCTSQIEFTHEEGSLHYVDVLNLCNVFTTDENVPSEKLLALLIETMLCENFTNELVRHRCAMFLRDVIRLKSPLYNENRQYWRNFLLRDVKKCYEKYIFVEKLKERTKIVVESIHCDDDKRKEYAGIRLYFKMMCEILEQDLAGFLDQFSETCWKPEYLSSADRRPLIAELLWPDGVCHTVRKRSMDFLNDLVLILCDEESFVSGSASMLLGACCECERLTSPEQMISSSNVKLPVGKKNFCFQLRSKLSDQNIERIHLPWLRLAFEGKL